MRRELLEAMSAGAENCRRADSISYIYNQQVFEYEGKCGEMGTARRIRGLARAFSNEMRQISGGEVPEFETRPGYSCVSVVFQLPRGPPEVGSAR